MATTIIQKVFFKNTTARDLFDLYMNSKKHSAATGSIAKISLKEGGSYSAHDGYIAGKNLQLIPNKLIVQSWRADNWKKDVVDSTFIINLEQKENDVILHMVHANLPEDEAESISNGWKEYYWKPWKRYLAGKPV